MAQSNLMPDLKPTATGTHSRVQMQRIGALNLHGTLISYNTADGSFTALFDMQSPGAVPYIFTPAPDDLAPHYLDQFNAVWTLTRS